MHFQSTTLAAVLASASAATAANLGKRDSWGQAFSLGPAKQQIISTTTTIYPGEPIPNQGGYLFAYLGISNGTGDLIQSIVGSYPDGASECSGDPSTSWCISSEVYGLASNGYPNQWVGDQTTADTDYADGIIFNYTLTDASTYTWTQTMTNAKTGVLLSSYTKNSGPMLGWGTALECDDYNGVACSGTIASQTFSNSTITLAAADPTFTDTMGAGADVTHTDMVTTDGGLTWTIAEIVIPAMQSGSSSTSSAAVSSTVAAVASSSAATQTTVAKVAPTSFVTSVSKSAAASTFAAPTAVAGFNGTGVFPTGSGSGAASPSGTGSSQRHHQHGHHGHQGHGTKF
ncbi:hypothetical protein BP6252_10627 [Coleophoma cylindrospora]|uniref:Uncharacterized protein n=1 Tax=Coleophoma cylindrospora TaxID=1849047 RepID=A0A3D8QT09_9HELO|nr:hypothetical protein BP6252_10627 [Coleophoma cylindrospora]